ncbi:MAG TPA: peptidoglycan editing factor PgeF [Patescibacteria group bacterium]|nr:peptidoglycan editing factor PgeF [Patescibacteria group bacterium]
MKFTLEDPQVRLGFSERVDGSMVWWNRLPVPAPVQESRDTYFRQQGIDPSRVVAGGCAHTTNVRVVGEDDAGTYIPNSDSLITNQPNLFLSITAADCMPVYFSDAKHQTIGIAHAGWRGLVAGILENVVHGMTEMFGSAPEDIQVLIGPHIKKCHFEIGKEVAVKFLPKHIETHEGRLYADMSNEARSRLLSVGVRTIVDPSVCTVCQADILFSARTDRHDPLEGAVAYIGR